MEFLDWFATIFLGIAVLMILFTRNPLLVGFGVAIIMLIAEIGQNKSDHDLKKTFIMERFKAGDAIECSTLGNGQILVDPKQGWTLYKEGGFIKEDRIINRIDWCRVAGKEPSYPINWKNWLFYGGLILANLLLRYLLRNVRSHLYRDMDHEIKREQADKEEMDHQKADPSQLEKNDEADHDTNRKRT